MRFLCTFARRPVRWTPARAARHRGVPAVTDGSRATGREDDVSRVTTWGASVPVGPRALAAGGFALAASTAALAGCTASAPPPPSPPAVTVTVSSAPKAPATVTPSAPATPVSGRHYDVGTIVGFSSEGDSTVLTLDRWTVDGVSDATLAKNGTPITPDPSRRIRD